MEQCNLCGAEYEEVPGVIPGELDLGLALHRLEGACLAPMEKQREFLYSPARFAAISGGFGASKTVTGCVWNILLTQRIPYSVHLVGRLNMPALEMTTRKTFLSLCPEEWIAEWKETKNLLVWKNGSETYFRHLDMSDALLKGYIRSMNLTSFLVDQSEEVPENVFLTLIGRLRKQTNPLAHFGRLVLNPAGQDWNWRTFFNPKRNEKKQNNKGFVVSTFDNQMNLPKDYIENMLDTYPEDWAQRFIMGSFSDFSDLVYKDFSIEDHVYDSYEWRPPKDWPVIVGVDIGGSDPWCLSFIATDHSTGISFLFDEIYQAGVLVADIATRYNQIMEGRILEGLAYDYENQQAAMELGEHDIGGSPAIKDVKSGIFKVAQYLHKSHKVVNPFSKSSPAPRLLIASHCENHIRELSGYKWAKDRQDNLTGKPVDGNDHACDSLRYAIHTFRPEPITMEAPKLYENRQLDVASRLFWHRTEIEKERQELAKRQRPLRSPFSQRRLGVGFTQHA